jgi:predicted phage-related endonuclease
MNTACLDRTQGLGGSDIPALLGFSPFRTPFDLYLEKIGGKDYEQNLSPEKKRILGIGSELEDFVIKQFEEEHGAQVARRQERIVSTDHNFLWATIDGMCEGSVVEVKTTASYNVDWKNKVPVYVLA